MAKFYVESGSVRMVIASEDAHRAVLWMVHRIMESLGPIYQDDTFTEDQRLDSVIIESLLDLESEISVNEQGFGRDDSEKWETLDIIMYWHQLMTALSRLDCDNL